MNQALQYLHQTLGIQYIFRNLSSPEMHKDFPVLKKPQFDPKLIFVNFDSRDLPLTGSALDMFEKIAKAMGVSPESVWWAEASQMGFGDFLTTLRKWELKSPLVILKKDPDLKQEIQRTGLHEWVEVHSLSQMIQHPDLKKVTWPLLQLLSRTSK